MKTLARLLIFASALALLPARSLAQPVNFEYRFGLSVNFYNFLLGGKKQKFPGMRAFSSCLVTGNLGPSVQSTYAATLAIYNKSLGNNMNPLVSDIQVDFINTLTMGVGWGGLQGSILKREFWEGKPRVPYNKYLRTMNQAPFYNLRHDFHSAFFLSTNFIINNHRRNQTCGSLSMTFGDFSVNYYNDGSFPFERLSLADGFDRYWTGGLLLIAHQNRGFNRVELSFDQFTGYRRLVYELSNLLGMNVPEYRGAKTNGVERDSQNPDDEGLSAQMRDRHSSSSFNSSAYNLKIFLDRDAAVDFGIIGSLSKNERYYGLQDIIHINGRMALHPNRDINRVYFGFTYNKFGYESDF